MPRLERVEQQPAYLLHHYPYRETSRLLEIFTPDYGRVGLIAKGLRSAPRLRAVIQPFQPLSISWSSRGELGTLHTADINAEQGGYQRLTGRALLSGYYINELILRLTARHDALPGLYRNYALVLNALMHSNNIIELRLFEKRLLAHLGYGLQLTHDNAGNLINTEKIYRFDPQLGATPVQHQGENVYSGELLLSLASEKLDTSQQQEAQQLLGLALKYYLGDKALRTREILRGLYRKELKTDQNDEPKL